MLQDVLNGVWEAVTCQVRGWTDFVFISFSVFACKMKTKKSHRQNFSFEISVESMLKFKLRQSENEWEIEIILRCTH